MTNKLTAFAKEIIEDCANDPKNTLLKTYDTVTRFCHSKNYTIEQIGLYLRKVRKEKETIHYLEASISAPSQC